MDLHSRLRPVSQIDFNFILALNRTDLRLCGLSENIAQVFDAFNFRNIFSTFDDLSPAIES